MLVGFDLVSEARGCWRGFVSRPRCWGGFRGGFAVESLEGTVFFAAFASGLLPRLVTDEPVSKTTVFSASFSALL